MIKNKTLGIVAVTAASAIALGACGKSVTPSSSPATDSNVTSSNKSDSSSVDSGTISTTDAPAASSQVSVLAGKKKAYLYDGAENYTELNLSDDPISSINKVVENEHGFFALFTADLGNSEVQTRLSLIDDNGKLHNLEMFDYGWNFDLANYKNNIYLTYDTTDENYNTIVNVYKFNPETTALEPTDDFEYFFSQLKDYYFSGNNGVLSSLAERGWIYVQPQGDNSILYIVDEDTNVLCECPCEEDDSYVSYLGGNRDYAVVESCHYTEDYDVIRTCFLYDVHNNNSEKEIFEISDASNINFAKSKDDLIFFYSEEDIPDKYQDRYNLYSYNTSTGDCVKVCSGIALPGDSMGYSSKPCVDGLTITDDYVYTLIPEDTSMVWHAFSIGDKYSSDTALPIADRAMDYASYGSMDYEFESFRNDDGQEYYYYYLEEFYLKDTYPNADKINADLKAQYQNEIKEYASAADFYVEDEFFLSPTMNAFVTTTYNSVTPLGDRYIVIEFSGYDYSGGAHGMPWYDRDMYDLTSGKHVDFHDLYTGSEEDFKRIVADYVDEYHKNNNDLFFASYDDYEEGALWEHYYEYTSLDTTYGYFTPDAYVIEYAPYELGPFSSGFIDVPIPLDAFGIEF